MFTGHRVDRRRQAKFKKYVDVYAKDQKKFFVDFAAAFEKLEGLGTSGLTPLDA